MNFLNTPIPLWLNLCIVLSFIINAALIICWSTELDVFFYRTTRTKPFGSLEEYISNRNMYPIFTLGIVTIFASMMPLMFEMLCIWWVIAKIRFIRVIQPRETMEHLARIGNWTDSLHTVGELN